jgi:hypothetical protein
MLPGIQGLSPGRPVAYDERDHPDLNAYSWYASNRWANGIVFGDNY